MMKILERSRPLTSVLDYSIAEIERFLRDKLSHYADVQEAYLFGSCACGEVGAWSDIDLIVIMETDTPFIDRSRQFDDLVELDIPVDLLVYTPQEFSKLRISESGFWADFRRSHRRLV